MTNRNKPGVAFWATVVIVGALAYVASSGPARTVLLRKSKWHGAPQLPDEFSWEAKDRLVNQKKWESIYSPLVWTARKGFGAPLEWYWGLFPIRSGEDSASQPHKRTK
jgi:hypothetical protein